MMEVFQKRFIQAKEHSGLRWIDIANRSGLDKASISQYKNGVHTPEPDALYRLAVALNVSMEWLTGADVPMVADKSSCGIGLVSNDEWEILNRYRQLDDLGKSEFKRFLDDLSSGKNTKGYRSNG